MLQRYLRHFAVRWDGSCRQGTGAELMQAERMGSAAAGGLCSPSGGGPQYAPQCCCTKTVTVVEALPLMISWREGVKDEALPAFGPCAKGQVTQQNELQLPKAETSKGCCLLWR